MLASVHKRTLGFGFQNIPRPRADSAVQLVASSNRSRTHRTASDLRCSWWCYKGMLCALIMVSIWCAQESGVQLDLKAGLAGWLGAYASLKRLKLLFSST